jgi:hypothetical protein
MNSAKEVASTASCLTKSMALIELKILGIEL